MRALQFTAVLALFGWSGLATGEDDPLAFFEKEIRPVLVTRCVSCHGPGQQEGKIRLDSRDSVRQTAGQSLADVVRGKTTAPVSCVPGAAVADAFDRWVALGFPWPENVTVATQADRDELARKHWAFQPVRKPDVPVVADPAWNGNPIDAFVFASLQSTGLSPSPTADRRTLIRRITETLTGLPPTMEEVNQFVSDPDPRAWESLVDQLLASDHYGEHWARHWLDVARYSDTKGYVYAREEKNWPHAWAYRDWVVGAFNRDLPYDRFLLLQLAADQVEDREPGDEAAMGFLTIGRRFLGVKHDIIDDRIDVVTRGMLGLTVGCARCHDHKYDPIPTADYYALHGVFDSSIEKLVSLDPDRALGDEAFWKDIGEKQKQLDEAMAKARQEAADRVRERIGDYLNSQTELDKYPADGFDQIFQKTDLLPSFVHAWKDYLQSAAERDDPVFVPWHAYRDLPAESFATEAIRISKELKGSIHPLVGAAFATAPQSFVEVIERYSTVFRDAITTNDDPALQLVLFGPGSPCEVPEGPIVNSETFFHTETINALWKLQNAIEGAVIRSPQPVPFALTLVDRTIPTEPRILIRGNAVNPGEGVPRQFLGILAGESRKPFQKGSGRLELARAIADPENPLTARVIVNRVWAHHFGAGLVSTPSDFGTRAAPPSHPDLLDWLAAQFIADGWSLKKLHRRILLSATYRQSSLGPADPAIRERALAEDPANRMLWRMNPKRLGFEEFRDAMMAATDDLDLRLGGKPVDLFKAPYSKRRALYGKVDRQFLPSVLRVFDFANPDLHIPQRNETTVPQQALFFLNHPLVLDRARALAGEVEKEPDLIQRVRILFNSALQRDPSEAEITESITLIRLISQVETFPAPVTAADWSYGFGAMDEKTQRVTGFTALPHYTGTAWQGGPQWPDAKLGWVQITATGGHPGNDREHAAVRRWTAPRAMEISLQTHLVHQPAAGDGIRAFVISSRVGLLGSETIHAKEADLNVASLQVEAGETIDFLVDIGEGLNSDQFLWDISLADARPDRENPSPAWKAQADFPADRVTPLTGWEQLAQALLCSNEFLFID